MNSENRRSRYLVMILGMIVIIHTGNVVKIKTDYNCFKYLYVSKCGS